MNKKSIYTFNIFLALISILVMQSIYLSSTKSIDAQSLEKKISFVKMSGLPDLAISTDTTYVRHRSISDFFSIYRDDGSLREYAPSTFTLSHSNMNARINE